MTSGRRRWTDLRLRLGSLLTDGLALSRGVDAYRRARRQPGSLPRLSYAVGRIPGVNEVVHGGLVKVQLLDRVFPEALGDFNLLYLVSSALPRGARLVSTLAHLGGARLVLNQDGVAYPAWHGPGWRATNSPMASVLSRASHVFYQSEFCKRAADRFLGPAPAGWEVLYNPVETSRFVPGSRPEGRPLTLLLAGNQDQEYRLRSALDALRLLVTAGTDARLLVTGRLGFLANPRGAMSYAARQTEARSLGDRVELLGPYTRDEAPRIFQRADILVHTKHNDPCPGVVLEALSSGLPVAYSKTGGVPELVGDEAGIGVEVAESWDEETAPDPGRLAEAVSFIASRWEAFSRAARQRAVERFDVEPWIERHRVVFGELADRA